MELHQKAYPKPPWKTREARGLFDAASPMSRLGLPLWQTVFCSQTHSGWMLHVPAMDLSLKAGKWPVLHPRTTKSVCHWAIHSQCVSFGKGRFCTSMWDGMKRCAVQIWVTSRHVRDTAQAHFKRASGCQCTPVITLIPSLPRTIIQ